MEKKWRPVMTQSQAVLSVFCFVKLVGRVDKGKIFQGSYGKVITYRSQTYHP